MKDRSTRILPCTCVHPFQDARYGRGLRVNNWARNAIKPQGGWRCTVCEKVTQGKKD